MWEEVKAEDGSGTYYYNPATKTSQWEKVRGSAGRLWLGTGQQTVQAGTWARRRRRQA